MSTEAQAARAATNPLFGANRLKLGIFAHNGSGSAHTVAPEAYAVTWPQTLELSRIADAAGYEAIVPFGRWKGYVEGDPDHRSHECLEPYTWAAAIAQATEHAAVFTTSHVLDDPSASWRRSRVPTIDHISGRPVRPQRRLPAGSENESGCSARRSSRTRRPLRAGRRSGLELIKRSGHRRTGSRLPGALLTRPSRALALSFARCSSRSPAIMNAGVPPAGKGLRRGALRSRVRDPRVGGPRDLPRADRGSTATSRHGSTGVTCRSGATPT